MSLLNLRERTTLRYKLSLGSMVLSLIGLDFTSWFTGSPLPHSACRYFMRSNFLSSFFHHIDPFLENFSPLSLPFYLPFY